MNTSTEPHLDVEEMLAEVAGAPLSGRPRDHLASCADCRSGAADWAAASDGVQLLVAATELPPWQFPAGANGHRPRRRTLITAAAAAAVLAAGGTTWGLTTSGTPAARAGLTAVTGCPGLSVTSGTLEQIDGTQLAVRDLDGQTVTVTTSGSTKVRAEVTGSLSDLTDGIRVIVHGTRGGTTLAAQTILANMGVLLPQPSRPHAKLTQPPKASPRPGTVVGTVSDVHAGGFTVTQELTGFQVHVTTSAATAVNALVASSTGQLRTGVRIIAVGQSASDGSLAALSVEQGATLPLVQALPSRSATGTCDPSGVASALAMGS